MCNESLASKIGALPKSFGVGPKRLHELIRTSRAMRGKSGSFRLQSAGSSWLLILVRFEICCALTMRPESDDWHRYQYPHLREVGQCPLAHPDDFLESYPDVTREHAVAVIERLNAEG